MGTLNENRDHRLRQDRGSTRRTVTAHTGMRDRGGVRQRRTDGEATLRTISREILLPGNGTVAGRCRPRWRCPHHYASFESLRAWIEDASMRDVNVYMEKPFTVNATEAESLIRKAEEKNLKVTAGHNAQFTHAACRMRELVRGGYLGGPPVHMEAYYCYDLGDQAYAKGLARGQRALGSKTPRETPSQHHQPRHQQDRGVPARREPEP